MISWLHEFNIRFTDFVYNIHRPAFEDEITRDLKHTGAGILSMANR